MKTLFIPLKSHYFEAFAAGTKRIEFRKYGNRWNEQTCPVGREVLLSHGYGKKRRLSGRVVSFTTSTEVAATDAWRDCYGSGDAVAACIEIEVEDTLPVAA